MKLIQSLVFAASLCAVSGAQAGAVGNLTLIFDWNSLNITSPDGVVMTPATITDPIPNITFSSRTGGQLSYGTPPANLDFSTPTGDSISRAYIGVEQNVSAAYEQTMGHSAVHSDINKRLGPDDLVGSADLFHERAYQATDTGSVTFEIAYSLTGTASIAEVDPFEYVKANYSTAIKALDETLTLILENNEEVKVLELYTDCPVGDCNSSVSKNETLSLTFDVEAGKEYSFSVGGKVSTYANVSSVPVPAAAWLFGTALLGLFGVSRRKNN